MSPLDTLRKHELIAEDRFNYVTRTIDDRFSAVEIWREDILFREFFFVIDSQDDSVYWIDFAQPELVYIEQIKRGKLEPIREGVQTH